MNPRILCDVDGVVADIMSGFIVFVHEKTGETFTYQDITCFHIERSPSLHAIHNKWDLRSLLHGYLSLPDTYAQYAILENGAADAIDRLRFDYEIAFVTSVSSYPDSIASKVRWLDRNFHGIPIITASSGLKHWVAGDIAIDDRYDTIERFTRLGRSSSDRMVNPRGLLFGQPWNEAPYGLKSWTWEDIERELL